MAERILRGAPASPGLGLGAAWIRADTVTGSALVAPENRHQERDTALAALEAAARALADVAARLPPEEAEIVETGVLMARDPALAQAVEDAVLIDGLAAADALIRATGVQADAIAQIPDDDLAARADDVRSLGRRAARLTANGGSDRPPGGESILIADDLGPADVAELASCLAGIALVGGGATSHAAIVARSLGIPMVTGLAPQVFALADGVSAAVDGGRGCLIIEPSPQLARTTMSAMRARQREEARAYAERTLPATTDDGKRVPVLANVASVEELQIAWRAGAEGIGLLRTELAFLDAAHWPDEQRHAAALAPIVDALGDHQPAVVRVLDFGGDKAPPFLAGDPSRGLELLLNHRDALLSQLRAIVRCACGRDVRVLLPMVESDAQVRASRAMLEAASRELGLAGRPPLGSMIETRGAVERAAGIAAASDFLSIGTNDLTAATLGIDRFTAGSAGTHDPDVLRAISGCVAAAHGAGLTIEVCGEAASDPVVLPLLVGLGVDEVSVGASRVGTVRRWIRALCAADAERVARSALAMDTADEVERAVAPLSAAILEGPGAREAMSTSG